MGSDKASHSSAILTGKKISYPLIGPDNDANLQILAPMNTSLVPIMLRAPRARLCSVWYGCTAIFQQGQGGLPPEIKAAAVVIHCEERSLTAAGKCRFWDGTVPQAVNGC